MAKYQGADCRLCRVEKTKLYFKGAKCLTDKCPLERRAYPPGQHGRSRKRVLGYAIQLREKQKLKRFYGMSEEQFRFFFERAERQKGITGENLLSMLERRLDNVVFLLGFSLSRGHARQLIGHGHFRLNDHKSDVASALVKPGDVVGLPAPLGQERGHPGRRGLEPLQDRAGLARGRLGGHEGPGPGAADARRTSPCRSKNTWSSSCTPSKEEFP